MQTLEDIKNRLTERKELEVEGCIVSDSLNSDITYDVIGLKLEENGKGIIAIVDDREKCEITEFPLDYFSEEDIEEIILRTNKF